MKISINNKILKWFGDNLFWFYILQRLPMNLLSRVGYSSHSYRFFVVCFILSIILVFIYKMLFDKLINKSISFISNKVNK